MFVRFVLAVFLATTVWSGQAAAEQFARVGTFGGQFAEFPVDARGEGMGLATTVNPTGPSAFWWNPAPLPESGRVAVSYTHWEHPFDDIEWRPLAVRASWRNLTLGYVWGRLRVDPLIVRTAYEPDGDGTVIDDVGSDLHQFGCSADLVPWLADGASAWTWTVGASGRYLSERLGEVSATAWDADLGTSLAWTAADDALGTLRLHGTFMVRNLFRGSFDGFEETAPLPRLYRLGVGLEVGYGAPFQGGRLVTCTVAYTWRRDWERLWYSEDSEHFGAEITYGVLALRAGDRSHGVFAGEGWSWGAGLRYRFDRWRGIRVAADYGQVDKIDNFGSGRLDRWTFTAGFDLP